MALCANNPLLSIISLWGDEPAELAVEDLEAVMELLKGTPLETTNLTHVFDLLLEMNTVLEIIEQSDGKYLVRNIYNGRQEIEQG